MKTEVTPNIDDSPERIVAVGLVKFGCKSILDQGIDKRAHLRQIRIDAEVDVFGVAHVTMGRQSDRTDDHGRHTVVGEQGDDPLSSPKVVFCLGLSGWGHRESGFGVDAPARAMQNVRGEKAPL